MGYYTFSVEKADEGKRIDVFLAEEIDDLSRSRIQKLAENGKLKIDGKNVSKNHKLRENDYIELELPEPEEVSVLPRDILLEILYEDEDIAVVNKPKGMVVHPAAGHTDDTLVNALLYRCGSLSGINGELRPGIVHRIDKDTSGVLVVAKNDFSHRFLAEQLAVHSMTRVYHAVTQNVLSEDLGTVDRPIGRDPNDRKRMAVTIKNSKRAVTHFKILQSFRKNTLIECRLETGRTHQIRVHMASIGHPLLGDSVYGAKKNPYGIEGQVLHAKILGFVHPRTKEYMEFEADYPEYFQKLLKMLKTQ